MKPSANILALAVAAALNLTAISAQAKSAAEWLQMTAATSVGLNQAIEKAQALGNLCIKPIQVA